MLCADSITLHAFPPSGAKTEGEQQRGSDNDGWTPGIPGGDDDLCIHMNGAKAVSDNNLNYGDD